jgi:hypothetical protein
LPLSDSTRLDRLARSICDLLNVLDDKQNIAAQQASLNANWAEGSRWNRLSVVRRCHDSQEDEEESSPLTGNTEV